MFNISSVGGNWSLHGTCSWLLVVLWRWVIRPTGGLLAAVIAYVRGRGRLGDVMRAAGQQHFEPAWYGPEGTEPYGIAYVHEQVRGRGAGRAMHHLLVAFDGGVARLTRGDGRKGRCSRHGCVYHFADVQGPATGHCGGA